MQPPSTTCIVLTKPCSFWTLDDERTCPFEGMIGWDTFYASDPPIDFEINGSLSTTNRCYQNTQTKYYDTYINFNSFKDSLFTKENNHQWLIRNTISPLTRTLFIFEIRITMVVGSPRTFGVDIQNHAITSPTNKRPRDDDLIKELESVRKERDELKAQLTTTQQELEKMKQQYEPSEEEVQKSVNILRNSLEFQASKAMVWRPSCKTNGARLSVTFPNVTRAEYAGLVGSERFAKMAKGKKSEKKSFTFAAKTREEIESILGDVPGSSVRYGGWLTVSLEGQGLRFVYDTETRKLNVCGKYILEK